jgi:hypothetical protein
LAGKKKDTGPQIETVGDEQAEKFYTVGSDDLYQSRHDIAKLSVRNNDE